MTKSDRGFYDWLAGFIDGEGSFFIQHEKRGGGESYQPIFALGLRDDGEQILRLIRFKLMCGKLNRRSYPVPSRPGTKPSVVWRITDLDGLHTLVEILDKHPLRSKKQLAYQAWREVVLDKWQAQAYPGSRGRGQDKEMQAEAYANVTQLNRYQKVG